MPLYLTAALGLGYPGSAVAQVPVDLELLLAVDASGSVDNSEYMLQIRGIAAAFRDAEVVAATQSGPLGQIAVQMMIWSDPHLPTASTRWHLVGDPASAEAFARTVERFPRSIIDGGTGIGNALEKAAEALDDNDASGTRRIIDLSGDGKENAVEGIGTLLAQARKTMELHDIGVNGLAITGDEPGLADYYRQEVIVGPSAFVMEVESFRDFAPAIRLKLLREIRAFNFIADVSQVSRD